MDNSSAVEDMSDFGHEGTGERERERGLDDYCQPDLLEGEEGRDTLVGAIHSLEKTIAGHCHLLQRGKNRKDKSGSIVSTKRNDNGTSLTQSNSRPHLPTSQPPLTISASKGAIRGDKVGRFFVAQSSTSFPGEFYLLCGKFVFDMRGSGSQRYCSRKF